MGPAQFHLLIIDDEWWMWWVRLSIYLVFHLSIHDLIKPRNFICVSAVIRGKLIYYMACGVYQILSRKPVGPTELHSNYLLTKKINLGEERGRQDFRLAPAILRKQPRILQPLNRAIGSQRAVLTWRNKTTANYLFYLWLCFLQWLDNLEFWIVS